MNQDFSQEISLENESLAENSSPDLRKLPDSGPISMSQVNVELGHASNAPISLGQADVRKLAGKPSGPISFADLLGKSSELLRTTMTSETNGYCGPGDFNYIYSGYTRFVNNTAWQHLGDIGKNTFTDSSGRNRTIYGIYLHLIGPAPGACGGPITMFFGLNQLNSNSGWTKLTLSKPGETRVFTRTSMRFDTMTESGRAMDVWSIQLGQDRLSGTYSVLLE